ncbi:hypothetical protein ACXWRW_11560, partial [Streptococcus pyogenes]
IGNEFVYVFDDEASKFPCVAFLSPFPLSPSLLSSFPSPSPPLPSPPPFFFLPSSLSFSFLSPFPPLFPSSFLSLFLSL